MELIATRREAVDLLAPGFAEAAAELCLPGAAALRYLPRTEAAEPEELAAELRDRRAVDLARGYTAHGPHLDELAISLGGRPLRRYGSQGEQRTAVLALLFAERRALLEAGRRPPADAPRRCDERARRAIAVPSSRAGSPRAAARPC